MPAVDLGLPSNSAAFLFRECAHPGWARRASDGLAASIRLILAQLRPFAKRNKQAVKPRAAQAAFIRLRQSFTGG